MNKQRAEEALQIARELVRTAHSATDFNNAFFGIGGKFGELFPRRADREAFLQTTEYKEISRMRAELRKAQRG